MKLFVLFFACVMFYGCNSQTELDSEIDSVVPEKEINASVSVDSENQFEDELIEKALLVPPQYYDEDKSYQNSMDVNDENDWAVDKVDGILVVGAITSEAIEYYDNLVFDIENGNSHKGLFRVKYSYSASVDFYETFDSTDWDKYFDYQYAEVTLNDVYVVEMKLSWYSYCGTLCSQSFGAIRLVVFDEEGNLIMVIGDEKQKLMIMS